MYSTDVAVQNAAGQWVDPAEAEESDVGFPVRFVDDIIAQDSTGRWVDATPIKGGGVFAWIAGLFAQRVKDDATSSFIVDDASGARIYAEVKNG